MRVTETGIPGMVVIEPVVFRDARGFFLETFHADKYAAAGLPATFVQDNHSLSVRGTLRGLHMQLRRPQGKLVRVIEGEIWDVAVDLRPDSPTYGQWRAETLSAENHKQIYIPIGCAHGFCVLSDRAQVQYKCTDLYDPADEVGIIYSDSRLNIQWPIADPILSERDQRHGTLTDLESRLAPSAAR